MREKVMKSTASFILISLLLASIFAGAVSGADVRAGGAEENENPDQEEEGNDGVGNANVTATSNITCNSCGDCSNKLNGKYDTVKLTKDLVNVKGSCITFGANNVVFDGNGQKIDGDDVGEFDSGIMMSSKSGNTIKNCVITDFESGITLYRSTKNKIYDNEVSSNYYDGIWISTNSDSNNIHDNRIEDNGKYGVYFSSDSNNNIFSKNVVCSNPTDIHDNDKNSGDDNTCDTAHNWNDDGTNGCTYSCPAEKPDLMITDIQCDSENHRIGYTIKNIGAATASKGHYTTLFVDGALQIKEQVDVDLAPGASSQRYFDYYSWQCTPPHDTVKVCTDYGDFVDESNEENNCREKTCECAPSEKPDLVITDVWNEDSTICYQIRNIGNATAPKGHYTALSIDGEPVVNDLVEVELAPKERLKHCFNYIRQCSPPDDTITVCADHKDDVDEIDETNNCRNETWECDTMPPVIISGPIVSEITRSSVTISWTTNEDSDSLVRFGRTAGKYEDQKSSMKMKQEHKVILTDLLPSTTYHYVVQSIDASENTVVSRDGLFETGPAPDDEPPVISSLNITSVVSNL
jgi:parallel beta-helix repeat protein